jgi:1-acyl-sn-glycerol-3-phosphate acyltransferase
MTAGPLPFARGLAATLRSACRTVALLAISAVAMPLQALLMRLVHGQRAFAIPRLWHRGVCAILGIDVEVVGRRAQGDGIVFVGNHVSHFDIPALGSVLPARFIAKDDMRSWPGVPFIAGLQQTVFISRRTRDAAAVAAQMRDVLRQGHNLVLFAEGTTSSGERVAPFKSSLFAPLIATIGPAVADERRIQPFTIELLAVDGHALRGARDRDRYAYYGGMDALAHLRGFLRGRGARLRLHLHAPIAVTSNMDRKSLTARVQAAVAAPLAARETMLPPDPRSSRPDA